MAQHVDHEERRREIVEVARRLILSGGFRAATMRSMAAEAGYAHSALKYYFPDGKSAIVGEAFEGLLAEVSPAARARLGGEGTKLRRYLRAWFPESAGETRNGRLFVSLWEEAMSHPALVDLYREHLESWRREVIERFEAASAAGEIAHPGPYGGFADEYLSFMMGTLVTNLMYPEGEHLHDVDAYLDGLMTRLGERSQPPA
ncbi:MAG: TetR/AcrR family transcriptional regulator [Leucobacter sp.]